MVSFKYCRKSSAPYVAKNSLQQIDCIIIYLASSITDWEDDVQGAKRTVSTLEPVVMHRKRITIQNGKLILYVKKTMISKQKY